MFLKHNLKTLEIKDGEIFIKHFQSFQSFIEQLSIARAVVIDGCDHNQMSQKTCQMIEKNYNFITNIYVVPL
jgi:hypothetical protein